MGNDSIAGIPGDHIAFARSTAADRDAPVVIQNADASIGIPQCCCTRTVQSDVIAPDHRAGNIQQRNSVPVIKPGADVC